MTTNISKAPFLSKSRFIKGMQCHKALWLQTYRSDLIPETPPERQAVFNAGHEVGELAQELYPGGIEIPFDGVRLADQVKQTRALIDAGTKTIYEAAFSYDNIFVKADILTQNGRGWSLWEVKSSTEAKEVYINDVAIQYHVISNSGIKLDSAGLVLIDTGYVRQGDIEPDKLFFREDVTEEVLERQANIIKEAAAQKSMLQAPEPKIDIGPYCNDPYECDFIGHCWQHIPDNSVFDLADIGKPAPFVLYHQGIVRMEDIKPEQLNWRQQLQLAGNLKHENYLDVDAVRDFLAGISYPLAYLDFETTCLTAIPLFDGTRPFQPVPFQFSLHCQESPGGELRHHEFLAPEIGDPQEAFVTAMLESIPKTGCILTWNKAFEGKIIRALAERFPGYASDLNGLLDRLVDQMEPFRSKRIYHWQFNGSYSIKSVLPALVPELSYENLPISDGGMAADAWLQMRGTNSKNEREKIRNNLLDYCRMDTLAMVRILEKMKEMITNRYL